MSQVFISYRQTDDEQKQRVRAFAERLRDSEIDVAFDQFFLDDNPAGPNDGWPKWSSDRALKTDYVLIIGTSDWYQCFEGTQPPGTGLGAACEAADIRTRIYKAANIIPNIRVVLLKDGDDENFPDKLSPYHRFHGERDLPNIVRWLGGEIEVDDKPRTSIPHNLPALQPFFGREEELKKIADALDPESRTWGALLDGPGGMGKTSLAVRAAYDAPPEHFEKIVFVSLKSRELDDDGVRDLSGFLISGLAELLNELSRELGHDEISKATDAKRPRMLLDVLRGTRTLLVLDNLESLLKSERDIIFSFVKRLPPGCKAILTSRQRIGSAAEELILEKLSEQAAFATLAKLAESNPAFAKTSEAERLALYNQTGGKPLLLRWTAGQIGRGSCLTLSDAIDYLRSCPDGNDPLEFIFGDLVDDFSEAETIVLCALTYFTLSAKVEHISELSACPETDVKSALRRLINRSLVVPSEELQTFTLVPLVTDFLSKKKPEVVRETGDRLEKRAYALIVENGYNQHNRFPVIEAAWPMVAAALRQFLRGANDRLQTICEALFQPCNFSGHYDESLALNSDAENRAVSAGDFRNAGWRAHRAGWVYYLRGESRNVLACADRAEEYWLEARVGARARALAIHLRGLGYITADDNQSAVIAYREAVELLRRLDHKTDLAMCLNSLGTAERASGDFDAADHNYSEALQIARSIGHREGIATCTGSLANLASCREDWLLAEALAREALSLSQELGRQELIASACATLVDALMRQGKKAEAIPYARLAVNILVQLGSMDVDAAQKTLTECEA